MKKIIFFIFLLTFYFSLLISTAHAQSVELSINPPVVEAIVAPNKKFSQVFKFKTSQAGVVVIPELHLVKPSGTDGHSTIDPTPVDPATIPLVVTSSPSFGSRVNLAGNDATFTLTFEAASSDLSQDIYLALVLRVEPVDLFEKSSVTSPAISSLILTTITADGTYPINLEIQNFEPTLFHDSWQSLDIAPLLQNNSSFMIRPVGKYEIVSPTGRSIYTAELYPNLILGKSSRSIKGILNDLPISLDWQPKWSNIGPHKLKLTIETQGGTKLSQIEKLVWIIPLRLLVILVLLIIIVYRLTRPKQPSTLDSTV